MLKLWRELHLPQVGHVHLLIPPAGHRKPRRQSRKKDRLHVLRLPFSSFLFFSLWFFWLFRVFQRMKPLHSLWQLPTHSSAHFRTNWERCADPKVKPTSCCLCCFLFENQDEGEVWGEMNTFLKTQIVFQTFFQKMFYSVFAILASRKMPQTGKLSHKRSLSNRRTKQELPWYGIKRNGWHGTS